MSENNQTEKEVLLKVEHLCQYFKMGAGRELKAVDDVNFEIYKGEVFGLVGESGCGKTTTGRSIIKLYDITSGNVYFEGQRICAGTRSYTEAIKAARAEYRAETKEIKRLAKEEAEANGVKKDFKNLFGFKYEMNPELATRYADAQQKFHNTEGELRAEIASAKRDNSSCNKIFAEGEMAKVRAEYEPKLAAETDEEKKAEIEKEFKKELRLAKKSRIMNNIQMIFQDPIASLDPRMTVRDIIAEGLIIRGIKDKKLIDEQVFKMLDFVGLVAEHADRYPHEFSGGQRQRIGIARSIILNPKLIIADEPVSALDVSIQAQVINLLNDLRDRLGLTIMFIAHDLSVVKYFSDRIGVMYYGKIVELAPADELFAHPLHPYTKSLLSAIPLPDPILEKGRRRIIYNPLADHDYSVEKPVMREVAAGHFISCNSEEFEKYKRELNVK